jgi:hypothetical protein
MTTAIATVVLSFLLTGLVGNLLIQRWQHRNWINEQRFLGEQKAYENFTALCEEMMKFSSRRLWRMRRLARVLNQSDDDLIKACQSDYDQALSDWNERVTDFQVRLTLYGSYEMPDRFEFDIQETFRSIGEDLMVLTNKRLAGQVVKGVGPLQQRMNSLSGKLYNYTMELNKLLEVQREKTYYGKLVTLDEGNLESFKTWELVKALFKARVTPLTVVRAPSELRSPLRRSY